MYKFVPGTLRINVPEKMHKTLQDNRSYMFLSTHDGGACGYWRSRFISLEMESLYHSICTCVEGRILFRDPHLLQMASSCRVQRCCTAGELEWLQYVRSVSKVKIIYDIDDILCEEDMPECNEFRHVFAEAPRYIAEFMKNSDVVTVTNHFLRDYYSEKLDIPVDKFRIIPNYPPRFWFDHFSLDRAVARWKRHQNQPIRIGIASGSTHCAKANQNVDDCSGLAEWIIRNRKKYKFVFKDGFSSYFEPYREDFEVLKGSRFLVYPQDKLQMDVDVMIQPLQDNLFNRCKSQIKLYESWADGTPCFVQNLPGYREAAEDCCFDNSETLEKMIDELCASEENYAAAVEKNYHRLDSLWLDKHLQEWIDVML